MPFQPLTLAVRGLHVGRYGSGGEDQRLYPLSLGLYALDVQNSLGSNSMGLMMAGSLLMTLPVIAIFFFAQRYFIQGVTMTGMKG